MAVALMYYPGYFDLVKLNMSDYEELLYVYLPNL